MKHCHNSISRRDFIGATVAIGAATVEASVLGGCSSSRDASSSQSDASSAAQNETTSSEIAPTTSESTSSASDTAEAPTAATANGALVAVFSWSGNTLAVADRIVKNLQANLFRIEPATPYTTDYDEMLQIAQDEQSADTLPALAASVQSWDDFSTIYLGFPTWWSHVPQIVKSFLAEHDCSGKKVYPFNTHGGSGFASCLSDLSKACPGADIREGLSILGDNARSNVEQIDEWVAASM